MKVSFSGFWRNPCNRYISLWCLYLLQGTLYAEGSIISQSILLIILLISLTHIKSVFNDKRVKPFFTLLIILFALYTLHGFFLLLMGGATNGTSNSSIAISFLQSFYISVLPIFSFYYYAKKGYLTIDSIRLWSVVFVLVAIALFYRMQREALEKAISTGGEEITNNAGYIITALIPCVFVFKKQWMQYAILGVCVVFIFLSMKRGAILTGGVAIFFYFIMRTRHLSILKKLVFVIAFFIIGILIYDYLSATVFQSDYFQLRIERTLEGETSGRDALLTTCINHYLYNENILEQVFGLGANGTLTIAGNGAHNDWVEMLVNQGLIGNIVFLLFWFNFFKLTINKSYCYLSRDILSIIFIICFLRTFYSQSINDISIFMSSIMGLAMCDGFRGMIDDVPMRKHRHALNA